MFPIQSLTLLQTFSFFMFYEEKKKTAVKSSSSLSFKLKSLKTYYIDIALYWHHLEGGADDIRDLRHIKNIKLLKGKVKVYGRHWRHHFSYPTIPASATEKAVQYMLMVCRWLCTASWSKDVSIFFSSENKHSNAGRRGSITHFIE